MVIELDNNNKKKGLILPFMMNNKHIFVDV